jgi:hypothetical protein
MDSSLQSAGLCLKLQASLDASWNEEFFTAGRRFVMSEKRKPFATLRGCRCLHFRLHIITHDDTLTFYCDNLTLLLLLLLTALRVMTLYRLQLARS